MNTFGICLVLSGLMLGIDGFLLLLLRPYWPHGPDVVSSEASIVRLTIGLLIGIVSMVLGFMIIAISELNNYHNRGKN